MAIKGIKSVHEGIELPKYAAKEATGEKLEVRVTDGRSPVVKESNVHSHRTDHYRKEMSRNGGLSGEIKGSSGKGFQP